MNDKIDPQAELLSATDALIKPFVLAAYRGTEHDHQWQALTRPPTNDELAECKRLKKPVRRKVDTGEWWCQWCDTTVTERPTNATVSRIDRRDDLPLLEQLHNAITSDIGGGSGEGQLAHTRTPFDVGALNLHGAIDERIRAWLQDIGGAPGKGLTLSQLLTSWRVLYMSGVNTDTDMSRYARILDRWKTGILDIIDPPNQIPYRNQPCPLCGETRALVNVGGDVEDTVALWAFLRPEYRDEGSYGMCKACREVIVRDTDPIRLRARMNGAIAPGVRMSRMIGDEVKGLGA